MVGTHLKTWQQGLLSVIFGALACAVGCQKGSSIPNLNQSAPPLPEDNASYRGPLLNTNRYAHTATTLDSGRVLVVGGSDERLLTSLDTAELFDQTIYDEPRPESITGAFIDTDFNGDPIVLRNGGRIYHTATLLSGGNVFICGGTRDALNAVATGIAEIFDIQSRTFAPDFLQISDEMIHPRFKHTASLLPNGKVLIVGGQLATTETIIDPNFPPGDPRFSIDVLTFPSTKSIEVFDPTNLTFSSVTDFTGLPSELNTPRGRTALGTGQIAGVDNLLNTSDDVYVHLGGLQTLSPLFAPQLKLPRIFNTDKLTSVEYYDVQTSTNAVASGIAVAERVNAPILLNLGQFTPDTPDGVPGVNNVLLVTNGDDDHKPQNLCSDSQPQSELIAVTFTGFGPANGITFFHQTDPLEVMANELITAFGSPPCNPVGRTGAPALMMPARRLLDGQNFDSNWAITVGGAHTYCTPNGAQGENFIGWCTNEILGYMYFDPFYDGNIALECLTDCDCVQCLLGVQLPGCPNPPPAGCTDPVADLGVMPPYDLTANRGVLHPTGIVGTWLDADGFVPQDDDLGGYASFTQDDVAPLVALHEQRLFHTMSAIPGEDGVLNTPDDRVLVVGGGKSWTLDGGEPAAISSEIFLPFGANSGP